MTKIKIPRDALVSYFIQRSQELMQQNKDVTYRGGEALIKDFAGGYDLVEKFKAYQVPGIPDDAINLNDLPLYLSDLVNQAIKATTSLTNGILPPGIGFVDVELWNPSPH